MKRALGAGEWWTVILGMTAVLCLGTAPAARAGTSTQQSPGVVFAIPGSKQVSLTVCNSMSACNTALSNVLVLDPMPAVTAAGSLLTTAEVGQLVRLDGAGTGKPPLAFTWQVTPLTAPAFTLPGSTAWWDTTGQPPGVYTVGLTIANTAGSASSLPFLVTLLPEQSSELYTVTPCRIYDSRSGAALAAGSATLIDLPAAGCGIPNSARAVAGNLTVVSPSGPGSLVLYPGNYPLPGTTTVSFAAGDVRSNSVIMPLATDGSGTLAVSVAMAGAGSTHVVLDVSGYFAVPVP